MSLLQTVLLSSSMDVLVMLYVVDHVGMSSKSNMQVETDLARRENEWEAKERRPRETVISVDQKATFVLVVRIFTIHNVIFLTREELILQMKCLFHG